MARIVTAVRDGSGDLANIVWDVDEAGNIRRLGEARAGEISLVAAVPIGGGQFVTAVRDGSGDLANILWDVDEAGNVRRQGEARAGDISLVSAVFIFPRRFVTAVRDGSGNLANIVWSGSEAGGITRGDEARAGDISLVSAVHMGGSGPLVTAVRDGDGNLANIAWSIDAGGNIRRQGDARAGDISLVSAVPLGPGRFVTAVRDGSGNLANIAWSVDTEGNIRRLGDARAGDISLVGARSQCTRLMCGESLGGPGGRGRSLGLFCVGQVADAMIKANGDLSGRPLDLESTPLRHLRKEHATMKKSMLLTFVVAFGWLSVMVLSPVCQAAEEDNGEDDQVEELIPPIVFQAAGPNAASIQSTVDAFRAALGEPNNGNNPGQPSGRREINWDGGGNNDTTDYPRLRRSTCSWTPEAPGLPPWGRACRRLPRRVGPRVAWPCSSTIRPTATFSAPSALCACSPRSAATSPKRASSSPAPTGLPQQRSVVSARSSPTWTSRMDSHGTSSREPAGASTRIEYFDVDGKLIFSGFVPASPGDGSLSFFGVVFPDARIAQVRITTGNVAPGPDDDGQNDIVMMDDFLYGEPQPIPSP